MLAYVRKFTYLSAAKNSNKEYLTYGKGKHKIWENHSFRRNLLRKQAYGYFPGVVSIDGIIAYIKKLVAEFVYQHAVWQTFFWIDPIFRGFVSQSQMGKGALCPNLNVFGFLSCRYVYAHNKNLKNIQKNFVC